jgi:ABC-type transport system involved in multi-copper enzyme maturation permease subunit
MLLLLLTLSNVIAAVGDPWAPTVVMVFAIAASLLFLFFLLLLTPLESLLWLESLLLLLSLLLLMFLLIMMFPTFLVSLLMLASLLCETWVPIPLGQWQNFLYTLTSTQHNNSAPQKASVQSTSRYHPQRITQVKILHPLS